MNYFYAQICSCSFIKDVQSSECILGFIIIISDQRVLYLRALSMVRYNMYTWYWDLQFKILISWIEHNYL
jgi:hypothetical protein